LIDALIADRKAMLLTDTLRSLILTGVAAGTLWLLLKNTLKQTAVIIVFAVLLLFDLISIDKRYVNEADFNPARNIENPFVKTNADKLIQQDTTHYRVGNFTVDPMTDARTSYFHNSIGGYHAAKMGRYQELFEYQIAQRNMGVLDMLNTKYFLFSDDQGATQVQLNEAANGNAWFVENLKLVTSANEEMQALDSLDSKTTAVLNRKDFETQFIANETLQYEKDSTATIQLKNYDVTTLTYHSNTQKEQFAVFSEIYYKEGWNAYIDGDLTPHFRVNYVLRGMKIPAGAHEIVFQFEPSVIKNGRMISLIAYGLLLLFPIGWFFYEKKGVK
jgi:hypothetical protein